MSTSYSALRRSLGQRLKFWGGDISSNGVATTTATSLPNTLVDTTRTELDDEWDNAWIVLNPGSTDQVNLPTIWRRVTDTNGWVLSNGTFTIQGSWPTPYTAGVTSGTSYEVYKVFTPQDWLDAVNYALSDAYPQRQRAIGIEIPEDYYSQILDYSQLAKMATSIVNPVTAPTVTEVADGTGAFQPGVYTFAYTYFNDFGETKSSNTTNLTIVSANSRVQFAQLNNVPASVVGVNYYSSLEPGDTTLDQLNLAYAKNLSTDPPPTTHIPQGARYTVGMNLNGIVYAVQFSDPNPWFGVSPPAYNTTSADFFRLHTVMRRVNPGQFPAQYVELGGDMWTPMGGTRIQLNYYPVSGFNLKLICTTQVPQLVSETDTCYEPADMVMWGAEYYLWQVLSKTATVLNTNWQQLAKTAKDEFTSLKAEYKQDLPAEVKHRPGIYVRTR